jgi:hypothetical protein
MQLGEGDIFWHNIGKIQDQLLLNDHDFSNLLEIDLSEYKNLHNSKKMLSIEKVYPLAERLNFHLEDLFDLNFQLKIEQKTSGLLPRYDYAKHSNTLPILSLINYIESEKGMRAKVNILRKFQLSENFLSDPTNKTNVFLVADISEYISKTFMFTDSDFIKMGRTTPAIHTSSFLKNELTGHETVQSMYSHFFDTCTNLFDKNSNYAIENFTQDTLTISATPKKEILEELEIDSSLFGNKFSSLNRAGIISSMTKFAYFNSAPIKKTACLYNGSFRDEYLLDLSAFKEKTQKLKLLH